MATWCYTYSSKDVAICTSCVTDLFYETPPCSSKHRRTKVHA